MVLSSRRSFLFSRQRRLMGIRNDGNLSGTSIEITVRVLGAGRVDRVGH